jgi:hypothetical protein
MQRVLIVGIAARNYTPETIFQRTNLVNADRMRFSADHHRSSCRRFGMHCAVRNPLCLQWWPNRGAGSPLLRINILVGPSCMDSTNGFEASCRRLAFRRVKKIVAACAIVTRVSVSDPPRGDFRSPPSVHCGEQG